MGNKEMENKRKKNVCVVFVPPLLELKKRKGGNFVHPFLIFILAETRKKNKETNFSSFGSSLANNFKEEGRRKVKRFGHACS